nr:TrbI/VirB10 family protein [Escherichia coli]
MTDEQKPKTAAELENEMLAVRENVSTNNHIEDEDTAETPKPRLGIHSLKKTFKGKLLLGGIFVILLAGAAVYNFPDILRGMFSSEKTTQDDTINTTKSNRLTDLNKDTAFDPAEASVSPEAKNNKTESASASTSDGGAKVVNVSSAPATFSRSLAVRIGSGGTGNQNNQNTNGEDTAAVSTVPTTTETEKRSLSAIKVLPYDPNLFIPENTSIPCSLDRRFVSDLSGSLTCTVIEDIYSANGNVRLIDKGTRASLIYKAGTLKHGQGRVFIMATKLRTRQQPFIDIPLIDTAAAGALGEMGADGWIDTHFWDRFSGAMMLGMIPDLTQGVSGAIKNNKDNQTDYTANSRQAFADIAKEAFANSVGIPPTLYKNQGEIITLITGEDLDFSTIYQLKMSKGK